MQNEIVAHNDLKIRVQEGFFTPIRSNEFLESLIETLPWESIKIKMFGREVFIPRLQCWIVVTMAVNTVILAISLIGNLGHKIF